MPLFPSVLRRAAWALVILPLCARGEGVSLTTDVLLQEVARDVRAHFALEGDLQLTLLRAWAAPRPSAEKWRVTVNEFPNAASPAMLVHVTIRGDDRVVADDTLFLDAKLWREAWAARQPLSTGEQFDPSLLEVRRIDALRERDALPITAGDDTFVLTRSVAQGRLLTWRDITRRPLVHKGQMVEVTATDGPLSITMKAVAMKSGARGDVITLRNPQSQKDFSAVVIDESRAQIHL